MTLPKYFKAIENHLSKFLNDDEIEVFHEKESSDFHLDIYLIKPTDYRNYTVLMTNGISSVPSKTHQKNISPYIELCILLPSTWNLEKENYWPVKLLKNLGSYPLENDTWLGFGHTVSLIEPIIGTQFTAVILLKSRSLPEKFQTIRCGFKKIELYMIFPLYKEELEYAIQFGTDALLVLFDENRITDIVDINRKNVCKECFQVKN